MRSTAVVLAILTLIATQASAKNLSDWSTVQRLKPGTEIRVKTQSGESVDGHVTLVTDTELRLDAFVNGASGFLTPRTVSRADIREIYKLGKDYRRPIPRRNLALASLVEIAAGISIGAAVDAAHPSGEDPDQGKLIGGVLGLVMGPAALAVGQGVISVTHRTKVIYRAPEPSPSKQTSSANIKIENQTCALKTLDRGVSELPPH